MGCNFPLMSSLWPRALLPGPIEYPIASLYKPLSREIQNFDSVQLQYIRLGETRDQTGWREFRA